MRERERARAPERRSDERDLVVARSRRWLRSRDGEIAPLIAISPPRDRAGERSERLWLVFLDLCFPSSFPNTRKYFPENFLKCNQTHGNIFLFRKLAFPENMYFLENVLQQPNTALAINTQHTQLGIILIIKILSFPPNSNTNIVFIVFPQIPFFLFFFYFFIIYM